MNKAKITTVVATDGKRNKYVGAYVDEATADRVKRLILDIMGPKWRVV